MENENRMKTCNQTFKNKSDLAPYIEWNALSLKDFVSCKFKEIDFLGRAINVCKFKYCEFNDFRFRKCQFAKCAFENCRIVESDLTRVEFDNCNFINCEFIKSDLAASDFVRCEFIETTFKYSNLDLIEARHVKVWQSDEWVHRKDSSTFKKLLIDHNFD